MKLIILILLTTFPLIGNAHVVHKKHHAKKSPIVMTTVDVRDKINDFSNYMATKYGFDKQELHDWLIQITPVPEVFKFFKNSPKKFTPDELEALKALAQRRVQHGVEFYNDHEDALLRAQQQFGIDPEIIVGLIGIETNYGNYLGKFKEHEVLTTLAFYGNYRTAYFKTELEQFLVLSRDYAWDKENIPCSYAGAIGIPQFMPDNIQPYAIDWNNDDRIDLMDPDDAIGSVANFLSKHGWNKNQPIAVKAANKVSHKTFVLRTLPGPEPTIWKKQENFKVIRAYNPLDSYVMSIFILAHKVKEVIKYQHANVELQYFVPSST